MKIVILNGSARKGNTSAAIQAFRKGAEGKHEIEVIEPHKLHIAPCKAAVHASVIKAVSTKMIRIQLLMRCGRRYDSVCIPGLLVGNHRTVKAGH